MAEDRVCMGIRCADPDTGYQRRGAAGPNADSDSDFARANRNRNRNAMAALELECAFALRGAVGSRSTAAGVR
jgi:hypothetical protein